MTIEVDDKGKIFTDVIPKVAIPATVQTTQHLIHGKLHVRRDERLKDALDHDKLFLAMTDVQIMGADDEVIHEARFLAVRRNQIVWVMPTRELEERDEL